MTGPTTEPAAGPRPVLHLATGNAHKVDELRAILGDRWAIEAIDPDVEETGTTFEANALLKAHAVVARTGSLAIADDSGIAVDALDGAPGIHSARWVEEGRWISELLRRLEGVPTAGRTGQYVCAAAAVWPDGTEVVVRGEVAGTIAVAPLGEGGFGYDPIFIPVEADGRTFGELPASTKHELSHRGRAFRQLAEQLARRPA